MLTPEVIKEALRTVKYPGYSRDILSFGLVKDIRIEGGTVRIHAQLTAARPEVATQIRQDIEQALRALPGVEQVQVEVLAPAAAGSSDPWSQQNRIPGIRRVIAVASGKGGVGKSTVSTNLSCALRHLGARVGLLDCDIYGPSIPLMMGLHEKPTVNDDEKLVPPTRFGIPVMSMGLLLDGDQPVIWRGPMIMKTIQQFVGSTHWGDLDFLVVDLPPGTGDAQLSLCQTVPLDGGLIVTTPQEASLGVVRKGIAMFQKVHVPILGIVENMSYFTSPGGERVEIFGHGGGQAEATRLGVPFLGEIPLFVEIREGGDRGEPVVVSNPQAPASQTFVQISQTLIRKFN